MIFWVQICLNSKYYIAFEIIFILHIDDFTKFLISHCHYHRFLNYNFMVQVHNPVKLLIFRWFHHHHWMVPDMTFMTFFLLNVLICQGALWDPQWPPRTLLRHPKDPLRLPEGPSRDSQGPSKDTQSSYSYKLLCRSCWLSSDHIKNVFFI